MGRQYCIWIVTLPGYTPSRCFEEVAQSLSEAFAALGYDAPVVTDAAQVRGTAVALNAHMLAPGPLPFDIIVYNLEQLYQTPRLWTPAYTELMKRYPVWDYSPFNIQALAEAGIHATRCGIGYMPGLTRIAPAPLRDIDVLFIGAMNERRRQVLEAIGRTGAKTWAGFDLYGAQRDALFARAKIILNLHFYEAKLFEIVRVSYLLANRFCVVSETGLDKELEASFGGGVAFAAYDRLAETCHQLLADPAGRARIAEEGFARIKAFSQADMLKAALAVTP